MIICGKFASAKIFSENLEDSAIEQITNLVNHESSEGSTIRIMPDVHAGAGCVIGYTATLTERVVPNLIGVDIGCGMLSVSLGHVKWSQENFERLDSAIKADVPSGFNIHQGKRLPFHDTVPDDLRADIIRVCALTNQDSKRVFQSIGTLGGGNHFIEVGVDQNGGSWLTIHSGSRNFGLRIAQNHQGVAKGLCGDMKGLEYLTGTCKDVYLDHMSVAQRYATINRQIMAKIILHSLKKHGIVSKDGFFYTIESIHNYIDLNHGIIRKGAISARLGEKVIIPWNMRDGLIIGTGLGNDDWNQSAPHGAGRVMGRGAAKRVLSLDEFKGTMEGIYTTCVSENTIDESPMVYKDYNKIQELIKDIISIDCIVKPVYNFKAGGE